MHCLGQVICFYFCGYAKFLEYTLGIRLGHFRYGYSHLDAYERKSERLKYQEMSRSDFRASWGEEVSSPRVGTTLSDYRECSALAIPTLRFSILCLVCRFRYRFSISIQLRCSSFCHGHHSGNARGGNTRACPSSRDYARTPTRACTRKHSLLDSGIRNHVSSFSVLFYFSFILKNGKIPRCSCIRDMKKFLDFVVCDFRLFQKQRHNFIKFLSLSELNYVSS